MKDKHGYGFKKKKMSYVCKRKADAHVLRHDFSFEYVES